MGIYIKRMEMPENCIECPLRKSTVCDAFQLIQPYTFEDDERAAFCPMTEVPEPKTEWIPVKWHEITEEEREREGYPKDWVVHIDCDMPCDGDEILVQTKNGYIRWDVCYEDGEFSLDSGWDWIEDIVAWMPLPEPYREEDEE